METLTLHALKIKKFTGNNSIIHYYKIQAYHSIMCRYFGIGFIDFMLKGRSFLDYTNLFSPNEYEKNNKIPKFFSITKKFKMKKSTA